MKTLCTCLSGKTICDCRVLQSIASDRTNINRNDMTKERIQHLKDLIFTSETLGSKDKTVKITHVEAKELFDLQSENERLKAEREWTIDFDGKLMAGIKIVNNELLIIGAMDGYGNGISISKIVVKTHPP